MTLSTEQSHKKLGNDQIIFYTSVAYLVYMHAILKGCRRKSQRAEIKFLTAVGGFRIGDKITNYNITIQLKVKIVNVMVKYQRNKTSNVTIRCVCVRITATVKL